MAAEPKQDGEGRPSAAASAMRRDELHGVRVLIVDDNADAREILQLWFEYIGATVVVATSADEALLQFARVPPNVVLTDISMPHHDGFWLLRELRALEQARGTRRTPVIAMTALRFTNPAVPGGFDAWLYKPIDLSYVSALVGQLAGKRQAV